MYYNISATHKINKKKILILIGIIVIILLIPFIINITKQEQNYKACQNCADEYDLQVKKLEEEKQAKIQEKKNKEKPLSAESIEKIENIYQHQEQKRVFLTFDDGPTTTVTPFILDYLKNENIHATFFVLGTRVKLNPEIVKREYEEGHFIGNHGYSHKYSEIYKAPQNVLDEYNTTNQLVRDAIGNQEYNCRVFRFPGGSRGGYYSDIKSQTRELLKQNGIASLDWNCLTDDANGSHTVEKMIESVKNTMESKTSVVILMHDSYDKILTYEALPEIVTYLRQEGYEFKTLDDII